MAASYSAGNIQVLKGLEAVRKRPGMYIGSTGPRGLHHLVYETVDNCIDEAMAGFCDTITVALEKDDIVRVEDNGRGIPVDIHPTEKISALELVLTRLHAGGKFDKNSYKVSGGLHGVGVSCVNALSVWLEATIKRDGHIYRQKYEKGIPVTKVETIGDSTEHGTTIRWKADKSIFTETTTYDFDELLQRLKELAFLNSGIVITFRDERLETPKELVLKYEGGIIHYVKELNQNRKSKFYYPEEPIFITGEKDNVVTELAFQYNDSYSEDIHTYVNDINTRDGGTHLEGFRNALLWVLNKALESNEKLSKKMPFKDEKKKEEKEKLAGEDVRAGLVAVLSMKVPEPEFVGQTKDKLGNTEVRTIVDALVKEKLTIFFEQNPSVLEKVLEKAVGEAAARVAARKAKENMRSKTVGAGFQKPEKLSDCSIKDNPEICEVYIVEGDSAGGSAKKGRDSKTQAILPLWGKMLNVEKVTPDKVVGNDKLDPVIKTLGTGFGKDFNINKLRYHKIIIMADADVDGSHIRTLLLTFFFRYMPQLIENGYVYLAMPPLYGVQKGKKGKMYYAYSDAERDAILKQLRADKTPIPEDEESAESEEDLGEENQTDTEAAENTNVSADDKKKKDNINVQRYKGLGEMDGDELWATTMDPARRKMRVVTIPDAEAADRIFTICMGEEVEPRREFIESNSSYANLDI